MMTYSPILAIITAVLELLAALWALIFATGRKRIIIATALILLFLAAYQILEVIICTQSTKPEFLSRIAFMTVAWLPPVGLLLIYQIQAVIKKQLLITYFILCFLINIFVLLDPDFAQQSTCRIVFALFTTPKLPYVIYCSYYWLGLFGMIGYSLYGWQKYKSIDDGKLIQQISLGTLTFIVPSIIFSLSFPSLVGGLASIMCHFAILFAFFLTRLLILESKNHKTSPVKQEESISTT